MERIRFRFAFLPSSPEEREGGIVRLKVDGDYLGLLRAYGKEHVSDLGDMCAVLLPWNHLPTDRARNFFFEALDLLAVQDSGPMGKRDPETKDRLRHQMLETLNIRDLDGELKSMSETAEDPVTKAEWWELCQTCVQWLLESGGHLGSLRKDFENLRGVNGN